MIAQYNTLRNQLTGDYQAFYDKAYQYAEKKRDIIQDSMRMIYL